jgi:hypothetical protein
MATFPLLTFACRERKWSSAGHEGHRLPTDILPTQPNSGSGDPGPLSYVYKPSLVGTAWQFELGEEGLSFRIGRRAETWPYRRIAAIRLSYRPISMQSRRFRTDIYNDAGQTVRILSVSWQTTTLVAPQDADYRRFIVALHRRMTSAGARPALVAGLSPPLFGLAVAAIALVAIAFAGLLVRAVLVGSVPGMLFLVGFAALFGWQIGGFLRRNRPRRYEPESIPPELLP